MIAIRFFVILVGCCAASRTRASGGELSLQAASTHEVALLRHPGVTQGSQTVVYLPRLGIQAGYAVTRRLRFGIELMTSLPRGTTSKSVNYQDIQEADLSAQYQDVMLPLFATYAFETGSDWALFVQGATGARWAHWQDTSLTASKSEAEQLPLSKGDLWQAAWFAQARLGAQWRPTDHFFMQAAASFGMAQQGDMYAGLWLSGGWVVGIGPSL